jgi:23S rRNA (pseudouridine1915-N3)-methyltransferase
VHVYYIGKPRSAAANSLALEYIKRLGRYVRCEMSEVKPARADLWAKHPAATKVLLDPAGKSLNSSRFTDLISKAEQQARDLVFVVGGADGLPQAWCERADLLLALSPLTMPHELARVMLTEQLYRAFATLRGHPYPR